MPPLRHDFFTGISLFSGLNSKAQSSLARRLTPRRYAQGEMIVHQGQTGSSLHIVRWGAVALERTIAPGLVVDLGSVEAKGLVDPFAYLAAEPASCTATALVETETLELTTSVFEAFMSRDRNFSRALVRSLALGLWHDEERIRSLTALDASTKLARELLSELDRKVQQEQVEFKLRYSQEDLAGIIGTRRETVNRCLREMKECGTLVELGRNRFVANVPKLYEMAGFVVRATSG